MRRIMVAGVVVLALVLIGIAGPLIMDALGYQYINENRLYLKGQYEIQPLPKNTHVVGHAEGKNFSLYVLDKKSLERFKSGRTLRRSTPGSTLTTFPLTSEPTTRGSTS